jgi:hypothetical protein
VAAMDAKECECLVDHVVGGVQAPEGSVGGADSVSVLDRGLVVGVAQIFNCYERARIKKEPQRPPRPYRYLS